MEYIHNKTRFFLKYVIVLQYLAVFYLNYLIIIITPSHTIIPKTHPQMCASTEKHTYLRANQPNQ